MRPTALILLSALSFAMAACTDGALLGAPASPEDGPSGTPTATDERPAVGSARPGTFPDVAALVRETRGGVVAVTQTQLQLTEAFGSVEVPAGAGTGFLIDDQGHIVTNFHVIQGADEVTITPPEGEERSAEIVGAAPAFDLALLKVEDTAGLEPLPLGSSESLAVGEPVVAIGNALALGDTPTVSLGIVSAKGRTIQVSPEQAFEDLIQTDAAINPGNSGGPLLNAAGEVVGINTVVAGGQAQNIGFAIAIDSAEPIVQNMLEGTAQLFIGVAIVPNSETIAARFDLPTSEGLVIARVEDGGPAADASVEPGDVIVAVEGEEVTSVTGLRQAVQEAGAGGTVTLTIARGDEQLEIEVAVAAADG